MEALAILLIAFLALWLCIFLPAGMARRRGRSALGWVLLAWITPPIVAIIALRIVGDSSDKIRKDIINGRR